ncbi:ABC-type transport system permease protein (probable substrate sugar) (plasmid) [Natrialba magadii ATCC 43099]|uniref:ABC-type transport system permease protein (Probable substrate sugar) n=1 Tax=Natrialba magadii (strain ATCC 43099 / DSM 3394 / CCM 3739 / CIP 104546 / IAM 13178 / JCM 8861 / NBRC 102185 / NCIMB 2190 / MS3) TaxID=547559 RepID=D3T1F3_NATMM|nr:carbohydrate ABC transporter permease [Natrialba magadii]ADD07412.1 ABC-type transport system permease protein (probable substrate sugar) [Natrialba magadii ATCC 43099]ELY32222.1 binding-protein-dependent transport system inner membrane protein [Natrialba magadii ATCC 43099]
MTSLSPQLTQQQRHYLERIATYTAVIVTTFVVLIPLIWGFLSTVRPSEELFSWPPVIVPSEVSFENYHILFEQTNFALYFRNSLIVAVTTIILTLLIAIPAAYAVSRYEFHGRRYIANLSVLIYMFPLILLGIPLFIIFQNIGLTNSLFGLALAHTAFALPFALLLLRVFFLDITPEIEESARLAGASRVTIVTKIILPLSLPGIVATSIFAFFLSWNEYFFALIILNDNALYTLPLGIANLIDMATTNWGMILGGVMIMILPPVLFVFLVYKHLIKGFGVSTV